MLDQELFHVINYVKIRSPITPWTKTPTSHTNKKTHIQYDQNQKQLFFTLKRRRRELMFEYKPEK